MKIPVAVLTGFLGSGKTTVLNRLVRDAGMARALVVVNELGDVGLDHELVERVTGDVLLLRSGCLCCTLRSDLVDTLEAVLGKVRRGEIEPFDRVVVETTGLADPQPIMQAFLADPLLARAFDLRSIMTTVDALVGNDTLDRHAEAVKQAAVADRILLTKTDLAGGADLDHLRHRLRGLNATAPIEPITLETSLAPALLWEASFGSLVRPFNEPAAHAAHCDGHTTAGGLHNDLVRTHSFVRDEPIEAELLDRWLTSFLDLRGPDLLRFKAMVNVAGMPGPLVLHGVQHVIHPPQALKAWPGADRRTRMVFITYGVEESAIRASLQALQSA